MVGAAISVATARCELELVREMLTNPELVEKRKDLQSTRVQHDNPLIQQKMMNFDPRKSNVLTTLAAEERDKATRHA